jgi:hypothetical protein
MGGTAHHHGAARGTEAAVERAMAAMVEHHLVVWSRNVGLRERFALELVRHTHGLPDAQTIMLAGASIHSIDGFCRQLDRAMPASDGRRLARTIHGQSGIVERLRERSTHPLVHVKQRYYVWRDADALLRHDPRLFGRLVDALCGVAAEAEYASEDLLLLHRVVFIGGPALQSYAEDPRSQFNLWLTERHGGEAVRPLWAEVSGLESPPFKLMALS